MRHHLARRLLSWAAVCLALAAVPAALLGQPPDPAAILAKQLTDSDLGKLIGVDRVSAIVQSDETYADTAKRLGTSLRAVLDEAPDPSTGLPDQLAVNRLAAEIDRGLHGVVDAMPNAAARQAWIGAHDVIAANSAQAVAAAEPGMKFAALKLKYDLVVQQLHKLANFKRLQDAAPPSDAIIPARFWRDAFDSNETQLYRYDQMPLQSTEAYAKVMTDAAALPPTATALELQSAYERGKVQFLAMIQQTRTPQQHRGWTHFTTMWSNALFDAEKAGRFDRRNPAHIRAALTQSAAQLIELGKAVDAAHQQAADTGGIAAAAPGAAAAAQGAGGYGYSHAAVHHERVMARIHYKYERRSYRIQAYRAR